MIRRFLSSFALLAIASTPSQAAAILYEGFSYPVGATVKGQNGGTGFAGAWFEDGGTSADLDIIESGSLGFGALQTSGASVSSRAPSSRVSDYKRDIVDIAGTPGTTLWLSFLTRKDTAGGTAPQDVVALIFGDSLFVGDPFQTDTYALGEGGDAGTMTFPSNVPVVPLQTAFLTVRIDFLLGNDVVRLFVNPVPGGPEPTVADATKNDLDIPVIDRIGIFASSQTADPRRSFDEIRIGTTFADVAPVPEPSSAALLTAGTLLLGRRRQANRRGP